MFHSKGTVRFSSEPLRAWLDVDRGIVDFYRSLIPKYFNARPPRYPAHISFARKAPPANVVACKAFDGLVVDFDYDPYICNDESYWWLNCFSPKLVEIRRNVGLPIYNTSKYSIDDQHVFHVTIANTKV